MDDGSSPPSFSRRSFDATSIAYILQCVPTDDFNVELYLRFLRGVREVVSGHSARSAGYEYTASVGEVGGGAKCGWLS